MIWIKLAWWMIWRTFLSGIVLGGFFGTVLALILGAVFGAVIGGILGLITGVINGIALAVLVRRNLPMQDTPQLRRKAATVTALLSLVTCLILLGIFFGTSIFTIAPAVIAALASIGTARRFPAYAANEFWEREHPEFRTSREAQIVW